MRERESEIEREKGFFVVNYRRRFLPVTLLSISLQHCVDGCRGRERRRKREREKSCEMCVREREGNT